MPDFGSGDLMWIICGYPYEYPVCDQASFV